MPAFPMLVQDVPRLLDARPDRLDLRDRPYNPPLVPLQPEFPRSVAMAQYLDLYRPMILDQGQEGACTGYGLAAAINFQSWMLEVILRMRRKLKVDPPAEPPRDRMVSPKMLYQLARLYDEWDGEDYSGSSCRGGIRGWYHHGVCLDRTWPYAQDGNKFEDKDDATRTAWLKEAAQRPLGAYYRINARSIAEMQAAIQQVYAIYVSASVHKGWDTPTLRPGPDPGTESFLPRIGWRPGDTAVGVHAFAIVGYTKTGFIVQNTWGPGWAKDGFALLAYDDWLLNGIDAWAPVQGAPTNTDYPSITKSSGSLQSSALRQMMDNGRAPDDTPSGTPPWDVNTTTLHSIVLGNNGRAMSRLVHAGDGYEHLLICAQKRVLRYCGPKHGLNHLVIYAHGDLTDEATTLRRSAVLGPWFMANGIYPLFLSGTSDLLGNFDGVFRDAVAAKKLKAAGGQLSASEVDRLIKETHDYTWEAIASGVSIRSIWTEFKENVDLAAESGGALHHLALHLKAVRVKYPELKIHFVGHSGGAFALGGLLDRMRRLKLPVQSVALWAPACSMAYALQNFAPALDSKKGIVARDKFFIEVLLDELEMRDGVAGLYKKSFLYLVSRALERAHKTPLLGLESSWKLDRDTDTGLADVVAWRKVYGDGPDKVFRDEFPATKRDEIDPYAQQTKMTHNGFDQSILALSDALKRMLGHVPVYDVTDLTGR